MINFIEWVRTNKPSEATFLQDLKENPLQALRASLKKPQPEDPERVPFKYSGADAQGKFTLGQKYSLRKQSKGRKIQPNLDPGQRLDTR